MKEFYSVETGDWPNRVVKDANGKEYPHCLACHTPSGWILQHRYTPEGLPIPTFDIDGAENTAKEIVMAPAPLTVTIH